MNTLLAR